MTQLLNNNQNSININQVEEEVNSENHDDSHNITSTHSIESGDAHDKYLMLIRRTSLEEDQSNDNLYISP